jgi:CO/xanthine dehydrogenase FAD-binding subunit
MYAVDYQKPKSLADAAALLAKTGGKPLAADRASSPR